MTELRVIFRDIPVKFTWEGRNAEDFFYCRWGGGGGGVTDSFYSGGWGVVNLNNLCWWGGDKFK